MKNDLLKRYLEAEKRESMPTIIGEREYFNDGFMDM